MTSTLTSYHAGRAAVWHGDCLQLLAALPEASVDAIVTDPPYGLGFMGKQWDALPPGREWAEACLRVLKPGGHLLAFGGTRTWHRLAVAVEDAGFELRDSIAWLYGSGFPKSLDVSKAIDKAAGAERARQAPQTRARPSDAIHASGFGADGWAPQVRDAVTPEAERWQGWGTALKPAFEPVVVGRKPLAGTVAANVLEHGTGALNIDGCRVGTEGGTAGADRGPQSDVYGDGLNGAFGKPVPGLGRWPANVVLDESQAAVLDEQSGESNSRVGKPRKAAASGDGWRMTATGAEHADSGGASRFFYVAKAAKRERPVIEVDGTRIAHPTVKPLALMRWLVRLVTPPGGLVLDPFAGSGTTGEAALLEGFRVLLAEAEADYLPLIATRLDRVEVATEEKTA